MKKFLVIAAITLTTFSAFCAGTKKFGKMKDSDWVVTNAWQAMQHRVKPDSEWATNHFNSAEFSNAVGKVQREIEVPVKSVNGKTGDVVLDSEDVGTYNKATIDSKISSATPGDYLAVSGAALRAEAKLNAKESTWDGKQDAIDDLEEIREGAAKGDTAYQKPADGIPKDDLSSGVKQSLGKADNSVPNDADYQSVKSKAESAVQTEEDPTVPAWAKDPNPPKGMPDEGLVLTNGSVKTVGGTAITPENIGALSEFKQAQQVKFFAISNSVPSVSGLKYIFSGFTRQEFGMSQPDIIDAEIKFYKDDDSFLFIASYMLNEDMEGGVGRTYYHRTYNSYSEDVQLTFNGETNVVRIAARYDNTSETAEKFGRQYINTGIVMFQFPELGMRSPIILNLYPSYKNTDLKFSTMIDMEMTGSLTNLVSGGVIKRYVDGKVNNILDECNRYVDAKLLVIDGKFAAMDEKKQNKFQVVNTNVRTPYSESPWVTISNNIQLVSWQYAYLNGEMSQTRVSAKHFRSGLIGTITFPINATEATENYWKNIQDSGGKRYTTIFYRKDFEGHAKYSYYFDWDGDKAEYQTRLVYENVTSGIETNVLTSVTDNDKALVTAKGIKTYVDGHSTPLPSGTTVLENGELKTMGGTKVVPANIGAASSNDVKDVIAVVQTWEGFLDGSNVVFSITNYISGAYLPNAAKFRILELRDNQYHEVYNSREEILLHLDHFKTNDFKNATNELNKTLRKEIDNKADKAWGKYTSAGGEAPSNTVYMTAPNTVFAGGMEYERVAVGEGTICVLTTKGAPVWTVGDEGTFKFQDDGGTNYFGFAKSDSYTIGCNCDGIQVGSDHAVRLVFDITMSGVPCIWYKPTLENYASTTWEQLNLPDGTAIPGASHLVTWEENPDPGTEVCYINVTGEPQGFFKATVEVAGSAKFMTNMPADFSGGIFCTDGIHKVGVDWNNGTPRFVPVNEQ